jgi:hypothetical protein
MITAENPNGHILPQDLLSWEFRGLRRVGLWALRGVHSCQENRFYPALLDDLHCIAVSDGHHLPGEFVVVRGAALPSVSAGPVGLAPGTPTTEHDGSCGADTLPGALARTWARAMNTHLEVLSWEAQVL